MNSPELTVIIPTFNEMENIPELIGLIQKELKDIEFEIVIVDDDSPDMTWEYVRALGCDEVRVIRRIGRKGLASAVVEGLIAAKGKYSLVMDGDFQHDISAIKQMLKKMQSGYSLVIGSRYLPGSNNLGFSKKRLFLSMFMTSVIRPFIKINVSDPLSGFFIIRSDLVRRIIPKLRPRGFKVLLDILVNAGSEKIYEMPCKFAHRKHGKSKFRYNLGLDLIKYLLDVTIVRISGSFD